jgi:hypothetical protein
MNLRKIGFFALSFVVVFFSCGKDDDDTPAIEVRDRGEQQIADDKALQDYFGKHYVNALAFENNDDARIKDLIIGELEDEEADPPSGIIKFSDLLEQPNSILEKKSVVFRETDYDYYILKLKQGKGDGSPSFVDDIRVLYEGFLLNGDVFDTNLEVPLTFDLATDIGLSGGVSGWLNVFPNFNTADDVDIEIDGTVSFKNPGVGVMFLPSGWAYFNFSKSGIPAYSPLIFKFELLQYFENDHDNDGVPSFLELGVNADNKTIDTLEKLVEIDTDGDRSPNFLDVDDDGDCILTINVDLNGDGDPSNDIGANEIPNYLGEEATTSKNNTN